MHSTSGPPHKVVIFSQFTSFLSLMAQALTRVGVGFARLDGSMRAQDRRVAVDRFGASDGPRVLLCSLKAGGVGLNLVQADHVVLADPWWNPMMEDQAVDRVHRLGQTRPVTVIRLVAARTLEQDMLELHEAKRDLVAKAIEKRTRDDLRSATREMVLNIFKLDRER
mmetsp:Transcript_33406/g.73002  ORF Transcript_33406/g.73002 Transcript_33406/m.73002 type:complete len:167 (+) Transcript_33406:88-588(+)